LDEQLAQKSLTKIEMDADLYVGNQAVEPKRCPRADMKIYDEC